MFREKSSKILNATYNISYNIVRKTNFFAFSEFQSRIFGETPIIDRYQIEEEQAGMYDDWLVYIH